MAILQVGQGAHSVVTGLELGGRQERACLLRELGCGEEWKGRQGLARALPQNCTLKSLPQLLPVQQVLQKQLLALGLFVIYLAKPISFPNYVWLKYIISCISRRTLFPDGLGKQGTFMQG